MSQSRDNWETRTRFYEKECLLDAMTPEERLESPASRRCSFKGKGGTIVAWDTSKKTFAVEVDECGADGKWVTVDVKEADIIWNESEPPLIVGEDEWLSQPFFKALTAIFQAFDKDEDGLLSRAELRHFSVVCNENGRCFSDEELQEISDYFDWNEDASPQGLSITGWLDMYHTQTSSEEAETLGDLKRLGFDSFLNWISNPSLTDAADEERPRKMAKKE